MDKEKRIEKLLEMNKSNIEDTIENIIECLEIQENESIFEICHKLGFMFVKPSYSSNYLVLLKEEYYILHLILVRPRGINELESLLGSCVNNTTLEKLIGMKLIKKEDVLYKVHEEVNGAVLNLYLIPYYENVKPSFQQEIDEFISIVKEKNSIGLKSELELKQLEENTKDLEKNKYRIEQLRINVEINNMKLTDKEKLAERLFRAHQNKINEYYDTILKQSKNIFNWGIGCLILGGIIIISAIVFISYKPNDNAITIGIIGAIGGLFTNVIGAIFMNMYTNTIKTLNNFHNRFVGTHHLHFGNLLLSKIENEKIRDNAYASIFKNMVISMNKTDDSTK